MGTIGRYQFSVQEVYSPTETHWNVPIKVDTYRIHRREEFTTGNFGFLQWNVQQQIASRSSDLQYRVEGKHYRSRRPDRVRIGREDQFNFETGLKD